MNPENEQLEANFGVRNQLSWPDVFLANYRRLMHGRHKLTRNLLFLGSIVLFWGESCVPQTAAATEVISDYDYCYVDEGSSLVDQSAAGTPIPPEATQIITQGNLEQIKTMDLTILGDKDPSPDQFSVIFIPVGFDGSSADAIFTQLTKDIGINFGDVNLGINRVQESVPIGVNLLQYSANFVNWNEYYALRERIEPQFPHAITVFVVNTDQSFGAAGDNFILISRDMAQNLNVSSHEFAHTLKLEDGYKEYKKPSTLPNTELWYADSQPSALQTAVAALDDEPPVFQVGTCGEKPVYTYYNPKKNIMWDTSIENWEGFTPIQKLIMEQFIKDKLGNQP